MNHAERLDRLPFTRLHTKLLLGSGVGWALDAMDVGLISFIIAQLGVVWHISPTTAGWIASAGFIGMALGASLGGLLADKVGRRQVFALTLLVYGIATGASALSMSVAVLIALRVVVGLGLGAELPVASTLVSEFAPARIRGRVIVVLEAFWAIGWTLSALIGYFVVPLENAGWRWALALGAIPAVYAIVIRSGLPESVRFLVRKGRFAQAEKIVTDFERAAHLPTPESPRVADMAAGDLAAGDLAAGDLAAGDLAAGDLTVGDLTGGDLTGAALADETASTQMSAVSPADPVAETSEEAPARTSALWAPALRRRSVLIALVWFCVNFSYYGAFIWLPSLLVKEGITITKSFQYTLLITLAQLPGYAAAAVTIEKWGRRPTLGVFLAGSAIAAGLFSLVHAPWAIIAAGMVLSFFNLGAWGALYASTPELFPTHLRGTGAGWAAGFGRIASFIAPLVVPLLLVYGRETIFIIFGVSFLLACILSLLLPELKGTSLK
ncbi:MAG: MFS transporter [Propionibacteriaceae bacterium]|nr:MFS transporter [Propionibacteriaceae bacterium]